MKIDKKIIIGIVLSILIVVVVVGIVVFNLKKLKIANYNKYSMYITINSLEKEEEKSYIFDTKYDGEVMSMKTNIRNSIIYFSDFELLYRDKDIIYTFDTDLTFINVYDLLKKFTKKDKVSKSNSSVNYKLEYDQSTINSILKNLYIDNYSGNEVLTEMEVKDNRIQKFDIVIKNLESYDEVHIEIIYKEMNDDYKINTSDIEIDNSIIEEGDAIIDPSFGVGENGLKKQKLKENILNVLSSRRA